MKPTGLVMIHLDANAYLMREGEAPTCGYLIERGSLDVVLERPDGARVLAILGPGEIVGEMALIDRAPRTASVRARERCVLLPITEENIARRFASADPVLRLVLNTILDRFRVTLGQVGRISAPPPLARKDLSLMNAAISELRLEQEFEIALRDNQIVFHYQPIVKLADGRLAGFEALARWAHPARGLIPPALFIPLAETTGLSSSLSQLCLRQVLKDLVDLREKASNRPAHVDDPRISINISGPDLMTPSFIGDLGAITLQSGQGAGNVTLELTETALVHNPNDAAKALQRARRLGFRIAVDDFGTGYSSLNYIRTLPLDILKIDRSFVQGMAGCATTRSIVASTLQLAQSLGLKVVGEGVETSAELSLLQMLGCEYGQGYLFGRPLPLDQTLAMMSDWRATKVEAKVICSPSA